MSLIEYRTFRNADPPQLLRLWHACELGRAAAIGFTCDALDYCLFSQPHFDREGLIVACSGPDIVGYVHAGFGPGPLIGRPSTERGVIAAVMVRPDFRRQGIGRELVRRAEKYLRTRGAGRIQAGESGALSPFYLGLYGASESVGFLESDPLAQPFFLALEYKPSQRFLAFRRDITQKNEPFDARLIQLRRKIQFALLDHPIEADWWWITHIGRFDSLSFVELPTANPDILGRVTCWSMDFQGAAWRERTVGLHDLFVPEQHRKKAHAKALILEVFRRMRDEMITRIDMACDETNAPALGLCKKLGFEEIDAGVVYERT